MTTTRIMLVDDEKGILNALRRMLESRAITELSSYSYKVETFESPVAALRRAEETPFGVVLSDYRMPEMSGVSFLTKIKEIQPAATRMILSGYADLSALVSAINLAQIQCFMSKPWDDDELRGAIAKAIRAHATYTDNERLVGTALLAEGKVSAEQLALKLLQERNPILARVNWAPDGGVLLDPMEDD